MRDWAMARMPKA
jgi:hypothetical protein